MERSDGSREASSPAEQTPSDRVVSVTAAVRALPGPWMPMDLVTANDAIVRVARLEGEFPWHVHDQDELFLCWDGAFRIEVDGGRAALLEPGDLFVVRRGVRHRPVADSVAHALLIEKPETRQYGD